MLETLIEELEKIHKVTWKSVRKVGGQFQREPYCSSCVYSYWPCATELVLRKYRGGSRPNEYEE